MESRFDMTDFEHSLKDFADHFEITPSPRVWNGIYNHLHPGSRWPSMAMGLVFLFSLLGIGHLNNSSKTLLISDRNALNENASNQSQNIENSSLKLDDESKEENRPAAVVDLFTRKRIDVEREENNKTAEDNKNSFADQSSIINGDGAIALLNVPGEKQDAIQSDKIIPVTTALSVVPLNNVDSRININLIKNQNSGTVKNEVSSGVAIGNAEIPGSVTSVPEKEHQSVKGEKFVDNVNPITNLLVSVSNPIQSSPLTNSFTLPGEETDLNSNVVAKKATKIKRLKNVNTTWVYFVTPKVSSVYFTGKALPPNQGHAVSPLVIVPNQVGNNMIYNARLGFEAGTEMQHKFADKWQLLTGFLLSYSGYNILTHKVHPTYASLMLKNDAGESYSKGYFTYYGNGENDNEVLLPNYSLQASIPVGLQYQVWGNQNVKIQLSSTIQPSLVLKSHGYLLSSDGKNYVEDHDLMRTANLGANFASIVSFKSKKITWHIGPSVRYQALSSYKNNYPVKEHLIDYGLRIGISQ